MNEKEVKTEEEFFSIEQELERKKLSRKKRCKNVFAGVISACSVLLVVLLSLLVSFELYIRVNCIGVFVSGDSMNNTLHNGDRLVVERNREAKVGDIVIVDVGDYSTTFTGEYIVKRLIGVSGDTVYAERGTIYVKHEDETEFHVVEESYAVYNYSLVYPDGAISYGFEPVTVGEGEVFVLGDNRTNSKDSHVVGCLKKSDIVGVVPEWSLSLRGTLSFLYEGLLSGADKL